MPKHPHVVDAAGADAEEGEETCRVIVLLNGIVVALFAAIIVCAIVGSICSNRTAEQREDDTPKVSKIYC